MFDNSNIFLDVMPGWSYLFIFQYINLNILILETIFIRPAQEVPGNACNKFYFILIVFLSSKYFHSQLELTKENQTYF